MHLTGEVSKVSNDELKHLFDGPLTLLSNFISTKEESDLSLRIVYFPCFLMTVVARLPVIT